MTRQQKRRGWKLRDLVDFEVLLEKAGLWKKSWRDGMREEVEGLGVDTELERRRFGFRMMLEQIRSDQHEEVGQHVESGARILSFLVWMIMLLLGVGVLSGLLMEFEYAYEDSEPVKMRGFNIWILLGVGLGMQWLVIVGGIVAYWLWRKWSGSLSILQIMLRYVLRKWGGEKLAGDTWQRLQSRVSGGRSVISWRLARILQVGGIGYNCGLLLGIFGSLWFFKVGFYWESTLPQFGRESLMGVTRFLSFFISDIGPSMTELDQAKRGAEVIERGMSSLPQRSAIDLSWGFFFLFAIAVWGLLPRLLMWFSAWWMERRALAGLDFQESRHRSLWRDLTKIQRGDIHTGTADDVVLLDIGGLEIDTESLRPFCLQKLRVNPEARFSLGTLNEQGEREALEKARSAAMGVIFLVEGWNLSPKQMQHYHQQVRDAIGQHHMIRYLVIGSEEEVAQWEAFVDSLKDSETAVTRYLTAS